MTRSIGCDNSLVAAHIGYIHALGLWFGVGHWKKSLLDYADADIDDACGCRGPRWRHCRVPSSCSRIYLGVLFLVEKPVPVFRLALTASADVVSSLEASLSEPLDGGCCNGQGGHWFCGPL